MSRATLTNTTVTNKSARLHYTGTWNSNNDQRFIGGSSSYTQEDGGSVALSFNGSSVFVYGDTVDDHGVFGVILDGAAEESFEGKTSNLKIGTLKYYRTGLNESVHSIVLRNHGTTFFDLNAIIYTTPSAYAVTSATLTSASGSATGAATAMATQTATKVSYGSRLSVAWMAVVTAVVAWSV